MRRGARAMLMKRRWLSVLALLAAVPAASQAGVALHGPAPRPGPTSCTKPRPVAPQLTSRRPVGAKPILVSGATAYRKGEFLYQDFLYDDTGARLATDPNDPRTAGNLFSKPNGTYTYPTAEGYANNAADLVELRVRRASPRDGVPRDAQHAEGPGARGVLDCDRRARASSKSSRSARTCARPPKRFLTVHPDGDSMVGELTTGRGRGH